MTIINILELMQGFFARLMMRIYLTPMSASILQVCLSFLLATTLTSKNAIIWCIGNGVNMLSKGGNMHTTRVILPFVVCSLLLFCNYILITQPDREMLLGSILKFLKENSKNKNE